MNILQKYRKSLWLSIMAFAAVTAVFFIFTSNTFNVAAQTENLLKTLALGTNETGQVTCTGNLSFTWDPSAPGDLEVMCGGSVLAATPSPTPTNEPTPTVEPSSTPISEPSLTPSPTPTSAGNENQSGGLTGRYYNNKDFTDLLLTRIDNEVNFDWGRGAPSQTLGSETFSVEWAGFVKAPVDGLYTFYTVSDDGVRLFVDDQIIIENWTNHAAVEDAGTIYLQQGTYPLYMQFFENRGYATAKLLWASESIGKSVIPSTNLIPE